jgi:hypothetical protein
MGFLLEGVSLGVSWAIQLVPFGDQLKGLRTVGGGLKGAPDGQACPSVEFFLYAFGRNTLMGEYHLEGF